MENRIYPLTFRPEFRSYMWGGRNLETLGRRLPAGIVAESWEISGHPMSPTAVDAGPLQGCALTELLGELGLDLVGRRNQAALAQGRFPLLVKLLDAHQDLSVQVHPPLNYAEQHEAGEWGKSEMWYILRARSGAQIIYGLRRSVTRESLRRALEAGEVERCLHYVSVKAGDAILLEAGTLHALLAGIVAVEIQQTSDVTYRVYDWNRVGPNGATRPLHIEKALDVINFDLIEPGVYQPQLVEARAGLRREMISRCDAFTVERVQLDAGAGFQGECTGETFEIWGCVAGESRLSWTHGALSLPAVRFVLLPAALGRFRVEAVAPATLLRAWT